MRRVTEAFILCSEIIQNRLYKGTLKCSIFLRNVCGQPVLLFFSSVQPKACVWKTVSFLSSCIPGFFCSHRSYITNVLKINCGRLPEILTQAVAQPRGQHRNGQERFPRDRKNVVMPQIFFGRMFIV